MPKKKRWLWRTVLFIIVLGWVAVFLSPIFRMNIRSARRAVCLSNVRALGQACKMYSLDHDERFPDSFKQAVKYIGDLESFWCPSDRSRRAPRDTESFDESLLSYVITPGLSEIDDPDTARDTPLVYDKVWNHSGEGVNVFFVDGHAKWVGPEFIVEKDFDRIAKGLSDFFRDKGRYPTNEEGLKILVSSAYISNIPTDLFDPDGKRPYGYATKEPGSDWILTCYGPDNDSDIDLGLYSEGKLTTEDLLKLRTELLFGMFAIKRTDGDLLRYEHH